MKGPISSDVNGYVLAGGKSSRMGRDKSLLELAGKPLVLHAVQKLRKVCAEVYILGNRSELDVYASVIRDVHEGCGPLGGIEAAFSHSSRDWNLFMAVDMPFIPVGFLAEWVRMVIGQRSARLAMFTVDGKPQPALCLLHRDVASYIREAVARGEFKLLWLLEEAAKELALRQKTELEAVLLNFVLEEGVLLGRGGSWTGWMPTKKQWAARHLWFANLNTPKEFAAALTFGGELE